MRRWPSPPKGTAASPPSHAGDSDGRVTDWMVLGQRRESQCSIGVRDRRPPGKMGKNMGNMGIMPSGPE